MTKYQRREGAPYTYNPNTALVKDTMTVAAMAEVLAKHGVEMISLGWVEGAFVAKLGSMLRPATNMHDVGATPVEAIDIALEDWIRRENRLEAKILGALVADGPLDEDDILEHPDVPAASELVLAALGRLRDCDDIKTELLSDNKTLRYDAHPRFLSR